MSKITKYTLVAASLLVATTASAPAFAGGIFGGGGFVANVLKETHIITEDQRRELDHKHEQMGRPLDHAANQAAGAAANYVLPGSGQVVTQGLEARDRYNRQGVDALFEDDED